MSWPPSPGDPRVHQPPYPPPRTGLGLAVGAALGVLVGLLGPVVLGLVAWAAGQSGVSGSVADSLIGVSIVAILGTPVLLLVAGCVLMIPDPLRGWGVAALMASGVWLISSAGVCTVFFFGAMATYGSTTMVGL